MTVRRLSWVAEDGHVALRDPEHNRRYGSCRRAGFTWHLLSLKNLGEMYKPITPGSWINAPRAPERPAGLEVSLESVTQEGKPWISYRLLSRGKRTKEGNMGQQ